MHETPLLRDFVVLLAASLPVVFVTRRLGMPALVGFLVTGFLLGPGASGAIESAERVQQLAEIGVILLLFTIGLEFSLARLSKMARLLVGAGCLQLGSTVIVISAGLRCSDSSSRCRALRCRWLCSTPGVNSARHTPAPRSRFSCFKTSASFPC